MRHIYKYHAHSYKIIFVDETVYFEYAYVPTKQRGVMLKEAVILTLITARTSNLRISKYYCDHQLNKSI
jgi:hypothetical protein